MVILKNIGMLIVIGILGWWLYTEHFSSRFDPRRLLPDQAFVNRESDAEQFEGNLQNLMERVLSPLNEGIDVDPMEIEGWQRECQVKFDAGTLTKEQATAAWRLCKTLGNANQERRRRLASYTGIASGQVRSLNQERDPERAMRTAARMQAQTEQAWSQYMAEIRPRCEQYLRDVR